MISSIRLVPLYTLMYAEFADFGPFFERQFSIDKYLEWLEAMGLGFNVSYCFLTLKVVGWCAKVLEERARVPWCSS